MERDATGLKHFTERFKILYFEADVIEATIERMPFYALLRRLRDDGQVDVSELIQGAAESLRIAVRAEQATIDLDLEPGLMVAIGSSDLTITISNLVTNAAHAGKGSEATKIRIISHRSTSGKVAIDVIDNSGGMDAELAEAAFDLGASGEESTGVGLYLARSIIERAMGKLTWRSVDGGSCFTIELPEA